MKHQFCCPECEHIFSLAEIKKKQCVKCDIWHPVSNFYSAGKPICKLCQNTKRRQYNDPNMRRKVGKEYLKLCSKCKVWKPENDYYKNSSCGDKLSPECKKCAEIGIKKSRQKAQQ